MKKIFLLISLALAAVSCSKGFEEMNMNPNQLSEVNPEYLLNTSVYQTLNASCGSIKKTALDNYVQYNYGQTNQYGRYGNVPTSTSQYFKYFYNGALLPLQIIADKIGEDASFSNRYQISRIWKAYVFSQVTAMWGPVPMSKALTGSTAVAYDGEPEIYTALLAELKEAAGLLDKEGDYYLKDPVYPMNNGHSDIEKWIKFANSLRLRLAVRICNADKTLAMENISDLMNDESTLMCGNEDNCVIGWGDNEGTRNYYYDYFIVQTNNSDKANVAGEGFLMHTAPYGDPRLPKFFEECHSPQMPEDFHWAPWWGMPKTAHTPVSGLYDSTNPHSGTPATAYSVMKESYFAAAYKQTIMSYAEVELLKSELVHLGLGTGTDNESGYYEKGVRASMAQFGVTDAAAIDNYLSTDGIELGTTSDLGGAEGEAYFMDYLKLSSGAIKDTDEDPIYHQIIMQQYISMFNQAIDAWTLIRRSQVLDLPPHYQPETGYGAINAGSKEVQFAYIPQRFMYPSSELQDNGEEVAKAIGTYLGGNDKLDTKLWYAKPQLINKKLKEIVDNYKK